MIEKHTNHRDENGRFALDRLIRKHGFVIKERRRCREAIWVRGGESFTEAEILEGLDSTAVADAEYQEMLYREWE